jgi:hypothetical protein
VAVRRRLGQLFGVLFLLVAPFVADATPLEASRGAGVCVPRWHVIAETSGPWLSDVAALSPGDVWTVGAAGPSGSTTPVAIHWDGRLLRRFTPFQATRKGGATLGRLSAPSPDDVWAWGYDGGISTYRADHSVIVHWDGWRWTRLPAPPVPKRGYVSDFAATGPEGAWLVGGGMPYERPLVMHWDGRRWGVLNLRWNVAPAGSDLKAISVRAPDDVWAVGTQGLHESSSYGFTDLVLHWNGRQWRRFFSPLDRDYDSGPYAMAVDTVPSGEAWTANQDASGNAPVFVRFPANQRRPTIEAPGIDFDPEDIEAVSPTSGWIAGAREDPHRSMLVHWRGNRWRIEHIPHDDLKTEPDWSLSALSPADIWAAGSRILARYSC